MTRPFPQMHWLNATSYLLDAFASASPSSLQSPKETGVLFYAEQQESSVPTLSRQASTVRRDVETVFVPRLQRVMASVYRAIVEDIRAATVGPVLAASVLEPK